MALTVWSVLGRPGTEVHVFARLLAARLRASQLLSVPQSAAAEVAHRTHLGTQLAPLLSGGAPLPTPLVASLVADPLRRAVEQAEAAASGATLVLSGFPRDRDQLRMLQMSGVRAPRVLVLDATRDEAEDMLRKRRVCAACGEPMGALPPAKGAPPGAPLFAHLLDDAVECDAPAPVRSDADSGEAARRRLDAFDERTAPLIDALGRGGADAVVRAAVHPLAADTWEAIEEACGLDPLPNTSKS